MYYVCVCVCGNVCVWQEMKCGILRESSALNLLSHPPPPPTPPPPLSARYGRLSLVICSYSNSMIMYAFWIGGGLAASYLAPSYVIPWSHFQYNYEISENACGDVSTNRSHGKARPYLCFIICRNIFYSHCEIFNIVLSYPRDILHTDLIKVTILPSILFKKNLYILYNYEMMHYLIYKPQSSLQVAIILIKRKWIDSPCLGPVYKLNWRME